MDFTTRGADERNVIRQLRCIEMAGYARGRIGGSGRQ
jgi:hypothetical protein